MEIWIARDKNGALYLFPFEPVKGIDVFMGDRYMQINSYLFLEVTWENSPKKVELKLKEIDL